MKKTALNARITKSSVLRSVRRTELKEPEITKSSLAIWSAARISSANVLHCYCIHCHQFCSRDGKYVHQFEADEY